MTKNNNKLKAITFLLMFVLAGFISVTLINQYNPVNTNNPIDSNGSPEPLGIPIETGNNWTPPFDNSTEFSPEITPQTNFKVNGLDNSENWNEGETVRVDYLGINKTVKSGSYQKSATNYVLEWGSFGTGDSQFDRPYGIAIDSNNDVYVVDSDNDRIQVFDTNGTYLRQWGTLGSGDGQFHDPSGIAIDSNDVVYTTDGGTNDRVQVFDTIGTFIRKWGSTATLGDPYGIIVDSNSSVFVTDGVGHRVNKFNNTGTLLTQWGSFGTGDGQFKYPYGITADKDDNIFVLDSVNNRIQKFDNLGTYISQWGSEGIGNGQFDIPWGIGIDTYNNIYILDQGNDRVQKFDPLGNFIVKWGKLGSTAGKFNIPNGFAVDKENNFYVVDRNNYRVQKFETVLSSSDIPDVSQAKNDDSNYLEITEPIEKQIIAFSESVFTFTMYDVVNPSSIGIKINWYQDGEELFLDNFTTTNLEGVYSGSELVITVHFLYSYEDINVTLSVFDTGTNIYSISSIESTSSFVFGNHYVDTYGFDYIWTERGSVSSNFRSKFRYVNNSNFEHNLEIDVVDFRIPFEVYAPLPWNFTNIIPTADVTLSGNNYIVSNTLPTIYSMTFLSGPGKGRDFSRQKQILAIKDVTNDYLQYPSFENNWIDFQERLIFGSAYFDSHTINNTIMSEGISSLRVENTAPDYSYIEGSGFGSNEFYISFDYYIESISGAGSTISFQYWDGSTFQASVLDYSTTGRWIHANYFVKIIDTSYDNIRLYFYNYQGVTFIDNFHINKVNTEIITSSYSETIITSQFNYWTSYGLYPAINEDITLQLRDRTESVLIDSESGFTDFQGIFIWNWKGNFESKEYELRSIAWKSYWGNVYGSNPPIDIVDYNEADIEGLVEADNPTSSCSKSYGVSSRILDCPTTTNYVYMYDGINTLADLVDIFYIKFKANTTGITFSLWYQQLGKPSWRFFTNPAVNLQTSYFDYYYQPDDDISTNQYWESIIDTLGLIVYESGSIAFQIEIDEIRTIQAQKYYFTPNTVGFTDYAENELLDSWDFSEGDTEGWNGYISTISVNSGMLNVECNCSNPAFRIDDNSIVSDLSNNRKYYNVLRLRVKANLTGYNSYWLSYKISGGNQQFGMSGGSSIADNWYIIDIDLSQTNIVDFADYFQIYLTIGIIQAVKLQIDGVELIHKDSSLDSGYNWEFEEEKASGFTDSLENGVSCLTGTLCSINNGYISFEISTNYEGIKTIQLETTLEIADYYYLIEVKGVGFTGFRFAWYEDTGFVTSQELSVTESYSVVKLIESNANEFNILQLQETAGETGTIYIKSIRMVKISPPNLYETSNSFILDNENQLIYNTWIDGNFWGTATSWVNIPKNLTTGSHTFRYQAFDSGETYGFYLPSVVYEYSYTVTETDIMKILYHDQTGKIINFDRFKTWIDGVRLFDQYVFSTDTSQTFNLTTTDLFDNLVYQDTTELFENFKEIQITLYSVKILNTQPNPVFLQIIRGSQSFSEWILSNEIVKYYLESDTYTFNITYSDVTGSLDAATTNGTTVSFGYLVSSDSALVVTGYSIQDVFSNVVTLTQDLTDVNVTLTNQIINVGVTVGNVNSSISNQIVNVDINLDNINSTLGTQLLNIDSQISNLETNITLQITDVDLSITNMNSTLYSQTVQVLTDLYNINTTQYAQSISIINQIQNLNSTFGNQSIDILNSIQNTNSTLYNQTVSILEQIAILNNTFRVHFDLIDHLGIGIDWNIFVVKINDIRIYNQDQFFYNGTALSVTASDYFGVQIFSNSYSITGKTDISVEVEYYEIIFQNSNQDLISKVKIVRNGNEVNFQIAPDTQQIRRFTGGIYKVTITYDLNETQANLLGTTSGEKTLSSKSVTFGSRLKQITPEVVDASPPDIPKPFKLDWLLILGIVLYTFLTAGMGYIAKTRFWRPLDDSVDSKGLKRTVQDPIVGTAAFVPNLILNSDKRDETHKSIDQKRNSRNRD